MACVGAVCGNVIEEESSKDVRGWMFLLCHAYGEHMLARHAWHAGGSEGWDILRVRSIRVYSGEKGHKEDGGSDPILEKSSKSEEGESAGNREQVCTSVQTRPANL